MTLEVVFWDVQHGNSAYIKTPNDRKIIQDLGIGSIKGKSDFSPLAHLYNKSLCIGHILFGDFYIL